MSNNEYLRNRRREAKKLGLCGVCGTKPRHENLSRCKECRDRDLQRRRGIAVVVRPVADKFSVCCQFHGGHRAECSERA